MPSMQTAILIQTIGFIIAGVSACCFFFGAAVCCRAYALEIKEKWEIQRNTLELKRALIECELREKYGWDGGAS
jgi:hypothetical protein